MHIGGRGRREAAISDAAEGVESAEAPELKGGEASEQAASEESEDSDLEDEEAHKQYMQGQSPSAEGSVEGASCAAILRARVTEIERSVDGLASASHGTSHMRLLAAAMQESEEGSEESEKENAHSAGAESPAGDVGTERAHMGKCFLMHSLDVSCHSCASAAREDRDLDALTRQISEKMSARIPAFVAGLMRGLPPPPKHSSRAGRCCDDEIAG